uniref:Uncharacterized protein n=1 Tax=Anguilla anguilla TaxID=7936 RepID=A0A0E9PPZ8_ANGAN
MSLGHLYTRHPSYSVSPASSIIKNGSKYKIEQGICFKRQNVCLII